MTFEDNTSVDPGRGGARPFLCRPRSSQEYSLGWRGGQAEWRLVERCRSGLLPATSCPRFRSGPAITRVPRSQPRGHATERPPSSPVSSPFWSGGSESHATARTADREVLIRLRRVLAGNRGRDWRPDKREVGGSSPPRPIEAVGATHGLLRVIDPLKQQESDKEEPDEDQEAGPLVAARQRRPNRACGCPLICRGGGRAV